MADTDNSQYTGLTFDNYDQILDQANAHVKVIFSELADVSANSALGMQNRILSYFMAQLNQKAQAVYYSRFLDLMDGIELDRYGANVSIDRIPASDAQVTLQFTGTPGTTIPANSRYATDSDVEFVLTDDVTLDDNGSGSGIAESDADSVDSNNDANVAANTITTQLEVVNGVDSVTNPVQASGGADEEDDTAYRARLKLANTSKASPTQNGLYNALYAVAGVKLVKINQEVAKSGDKSIPDVLHFYVQGGNPTDVAQAIQDNIAWGIHTVGSTSVQVRDYGDNPVTINFDVATVVPIYVSIKFTTSPEYDADNGMSDLKQSMSNYINSLEMGDTIDYNRFYQLAYNIDGIKTAEIQIGTDPNKLGQSDIQLSSFDSANLADLVVVGNG